jgi:hypothetical protein
MDAEPNVRQWSYARDEPHLAMQLVAIVFDHDILIATVDLQRRLS